MADGRPAALVITGNDPSEGGGAPLVTRGRIQSLVRLGYDVDLLRDSAQAVNPGSLPEVRRIIDRPGRDEGCAFRLGWNLRRLFSSGTLPRWSSTTWAVLKREVAERSPGLVVLDTLRMVEYGALLRRAGYRGRIVLHEHNVEHELLVRQRAITRSWGKRLELAIRIRRLRKVESTLGQFADACVALSTIDQSLLARMNPGLSIVFAPPVVDLERYKPVGELSAAPEVLFMGSAHWAPNLDGLRWFVDAIWPAIRAKIPDVRLTVVGRGPPEWLGSMPGVTAAGYVEDERPSYARARVLVVPVRFGSGVRIKILNALAMGTPVVSTSLGAEGIPVESGRSIEIADSPDAFGTATVRVLQDNAHAARLRAEGLVVCRASYAPEVVDRKVAEAIEARSGA